MNTGVLKRIPTFSSVSNKHLVLGPGEVFWANWYHLEEPDKTIFWITVCHDGLLYKVIFRQNLSSYLSVSCATNKMIQ